MQHLGELDAHGGPIPEGVWRTHLESIGKGRRRQRIAVPRFFGGLFFQVNGIGFADGFSKEPQLEGLDCHCQRFAFLAYITAIYQV